MPLILDLIDNIEKKKVFIKMNSRIKKGDEYKAAFSILEGAFEPMVMFFGLINSLEIF